MIDARAREAELLAQLKAARQWLAMVVDVFDIKPENSVFTVEDVDADGRVVAGARLTLADSLGKIDAVIAGGAPP